MSTPKVSASSLPVPFLISGIDPTTKDDQVVRCIIEIPRGKRTKFEVDKETGLIKMDRYLYSSNHYPGDYGFIPRTLAEDGDALDILVMVNEPTFSGCLIEARMIGLFRMKDGGKADVKVLAVPSSDPLFEEYHDIKDVPNSYLREVGHFFETYKQLEGAVIETLGWCDAAEARAEFLQASEMYANKCPT